MTNLNRSRKNLVIILILVFFVLIALCGRIGWIQIVKGDELTERAVRQQIKDIPIKAERGKIYDTSGNELAVSITSYSVWFRSADIGIHADSEAERNEMIDSVARKAAELLDMDYEELKADAMANSESFRLKNVDRETAEKIRKESLPGIRIEEESERSYPVGAFASHTIGTVNEDNDGRSGLELQYNRYLSGVEGRWIRHTDGAANGLAYGKEKYHEEKDGCNIVCTIDQGIQNSTEKAIGKVKRKTGAKRVMAIVMNPENADILAMAQTPDFDLNNPNVPADKEERDKFEAMTDEDQVEYLNRMWRNSLISDVYEPGSTFKLLTTAIALEEGIADLDSTFTCKGYEVVAGEKIYCWSKDDPHGTQNLKQAVGNSCNPVFIRLATEIGIDKFYSYMDTFGITGTTGVDFPGEGTAILQSKEDAGPVGLATIGFGQGVAVTPIQLITAVSAFGNDGKLMKPRLVKEIQDPDGKTVEKFDEQIVRQVVSKETADEICKIMQFVVDEGGGGGAGVKGYRVGAKTGTADKIKEDGSGYSGDTYSSCIGMAPMDDPKIAVLLIVDSPKGIRYGSVTAAPGVQDILEDSLNHYNISPDEKADRESEEDKVEVPDVTGRPVSEAIGILSGRSLSYDTDEKAAQKEDFKVTKQYPEAGSEIRKGSKVYLYR